MPRMQPAYSEEELKQAYEQFQQEMQQKQANDSETSTNNKWYLLNWKCEKTRV